MFVKRILAAGAFVVATAFAASAADIPMTPVAPPPPPPPAPVFDWSGPYAGISGGYVNYFGFPGYSLNVFSQAGYNFVRGGFLAGFEVQGGLHFNPPVFGPTAEVDLNARVGFVLGERVVLYTEAGIGHVFLVPTNIWTAGGGIEFGVGQAASLFLEAKARGDINIGWCCGLELQTGLNWHM